MTPEDVTAVVVAHESAAALPDCLAALAREGAARLVVDNASRDGSADLAEAAGARVIRSRVNLGFGRACNAGAGAAATPLLLFINPDAVPDPGALAALLAALDRHPNAGLLAPLLIELNGREFHPDGSLLTPGMTVGAPPERRAQSGRPPGQSLGDARVSMLSGACLLVRRDLFLELGGFDPMIFLFYEDDDLCRRVAEAGRALVHVRAAVVRHGRGRSSVPSPALVYRSRWHQAWSRAYVSRKYGLPDPTLGTLARNLPKAALALATGRRARYARYAGSVAGALAARRGVSALAHEGVEEER